MSIKSLLAHQRALTAIALAAILLLTVFSYLGSLAGGLVDWDDHLQITNNLDIKTLTWPSTQKMFSSFYLGMYQPLASLSFALENKLWHDTPIFLHADSLLLHLINIVLVYWLSRRLFGRRAIALIGAALFALHPLQVESVAWVSARSNLLAAGFALACLIAYTFYQRRPNWRTYLIALFFFTAALFSKVVIIGLPVILLGLDYYQRRPNSRWLWLDKIPFFVLSGLFGAVALRSRHLSEVLSPVNYQWWHKIFFLPYSLFFYLKKLLLPYDLSAYYPLPPLTGPWLPWTFYAAAILMLLGVAGLWLAKRQRRRAIWLVIFYCALAAPTVPFKIFSPTIAADRYVYLAGLAYFWLIALAVVWLWQHRRAVRPWLVIFVICTAAFLAFLTKMRVWVWQSNLDLWTDVMRHDPKTVNVYNNLGNALSRAGDFDQAMTYYQKSLDLAPGNYFTYNNIASAVAKNKEDYLTAIKYYNQAIALGPHEAMFYYNRAGVFWQLDNRWAALADYQTAVNISRPDDNFYYIYLGAGLAKAQYELGLHREAVITYNRAIDLYPAAEAYFYRGLSKISLQQTADGCQDLREADKLKYSQAADKIKEFCP